MVTKEEEEEARSLCAFTNFCKNCNVCYILVNPKESDYIEFYVNCEEWKEYLVHPVDKLYRKLRCLLRLHFWFNYDKVVDKKFIILRKCVRCKEEQKYVSNKDYIKGKWVKVVKEDKNSKDWK